MDAENLITIFDCYWYELEILKKQPHPTNSEAKPIQFQTNQSLPKITTNSMDELTSISSGSSNNSLSPSSVLLPTNFSGKEVKARGTIEIEIERRRNRGREHRRKRLERGQSKSMSDLEFEELKGFMELGFVFSEEDKGSDFLTSILPGLQSIGEEQGNLRRKSVIPSENSRPYLSEVWGDSEMMRRKKRESHPLRLSWEDLPSVGNKTDMKDYIKSWAHNVASSVR